MEPAIAIQKYFEINQVPHAEPTTEFLGACQSYSVRSNKAIYKYYTRGTGPTVVLVHGIHSNVGSMVALADDLVHAGFKAVLFDIPAHGEAKGTSTDPVEVRDLIRKVYSRVGEIFAVVGHSLGGLWALSALHKTFKTKLFVSISSPANKKFLVEKFVEMNQADKGLVQTLVAEIQTRFGDDIWTEFSPVEIVKDIDTTGLVIHGKSDDFVDPSHSVELHDSWPGARLELIDGVRHFDIVGAFGVRSMVTKFLQDAR